MDMKLIKYIDRYIGIPSSYFIKILSFPTKKTEKIKKILMIKFSGFGNIVLALPTIRAIRKKYPEAEIIFLTHSINKSIIENEPSIDKIITFDINSSKKTFIDIFKLIKQLSTENIELIIDFEQFSRFSSIISFLSRAPIRIGFNTQMQSRGHLYNIKVPYENKHTSKLFADLGLALKTKIDFNNTEIFISQQDKEKVDNFINENHLSQKNPLVGIHPGCGTNNPKRKWPKENFAKLADYLAEKHKSKVFFTGNDKEKTLINEIQSLMSDSSIDTSGLFNLRELAYLISKCKIFFSNDTGPLHLASAMKVPVGAFFGPNTPLLYGPLGKNNLIFYKNLKCSPCTTNFNEKTTKCKHFKCMKEITLKEVTDKIKSSKIFKK